MTLLGAFGLMRCGNGETAKAPEPGNVSTSIVPVPFPTVNIPGFNFPEDSNVINRWLAGEDSTSITNHGWGIWAGLTSASSDSITGENLLVFETWQTSEQIVDILKTEPGAQNKKSYYSRLRSLQKAHQKGHGAGHGSELKTNTIAVNKNYPTGTC